MLPPIPPDWNPLLQREQSGQTYRALNAFLDQEVASGRTILPDRANIFRALELTSYDRVRVVLLGQDPYPTPGMAHGLCFSVGRHVRTLPPSLKNLYRELRDDIGCRIPNNGCLEPWARQGVLMLNTVLTVRAHASHSHRGQGWEPFTDALIRLVDAKPTRVIFVLWGNEARQKRRLITGPRHVVIESAHPSPLSVRRFWGCRCFSRINCALGEAGGDPIDWQIPDVDLGTAVV